MMNKSRDEILNFMLNNKAEWAMRVFDSEEKLIIRSIFKMPSKNLVKLSAAGSGKTWGICSDALSIVNDAANKKKF